MKRRILAILLAAIMVLSVVPFSAFAEGAVTCPGKDGFHGEEHVNAGLADRYATIAPTCNKDGYDLYTCKECGNQFPVNFVPAAGTTHEPVKHDEVPKSCTEDGVMEYYTCTKCTERCFDEAMENPVPNDAALVIAAGHTWDNEDGIDVPADCVNGSKKVRTCTVAGCGVSETVTGPDDDATGHKWVLDSFTAPPTCKDEGSATYKCDNGCGETKTVVVKPSKYMHDLTKVDANPKTCTTDGNIEYFACSICGKKYDSEDLAVEDALDEGEEVIPAGHNKGALLSETFPTCKENAIKEYLCTVCGEPFEEESEELNPYYLYWAKVDGEFVTADGVKVLYVLAKHYASDEYSVLPAGATAVVATDAEGKPRPYHKLNPAADKETKPTCDTYGYIERMCLICGEELREEIDPPLGHTTLAEAIAASIPVTYNPANTCTTYGSASFACQKGCGKTVTVKLAPTGHEREEKNTNTCIADGVTFKYCTHVGACTFPAINTVTVGGVVYDLGDFYHVDPETVEFAAKNPDKDAAGVHDWQNETINAATCTQNGSKVDYCALCAQYKTTVLYAHGHKFVLTWDASVAVEDRTAANSIEAKTAGKFVAATCTDDGYITITCAFCPSVTSTINDRAWDGDSDGGVSLKLPALGHAWQSVDEKPVCTADGYKGEYCTVCSDDALDHSQWVWKEGTYVVTPFEEATEYTVENADTHHIGLDWENNVGKNSVFVAGNCEVKGLDKIWCIGCERWAFVVQPGTGSHSAQPAAGSAEWIVAPKAATCTTPATQGYYVCKNLNCGVNVYVGENGPALGHKKTLAIEPVDSDCVNTGNNALYFCGNGCGAHWYVALADYNDGEPTAFHDIAPSGYDPETHTLEWFKSFSFGVIEAKGHDTDNAAQIPGKAATCMDGGYTPYKVCDRCGEKVGYVEGAKKDHTYATFFNVEIIAGVPTQVFDKNTTPNCVLPAYDHVYCVFGCGSEFIQVHTYKEELGHDWDDGVEQEQTCQQLGGLLHTCKNGCTETWLENPTDGYAVHQNAAGKLLVGKCTKAYADKICEWCSAEFDAHLIKVTDIPATCEERGYRVETCTDRENCPNTEAILEVKYTAEALGHKFEGGEEVVVTPATESSEGLKHVRCVRYAQCGEYKEVVIPADTTIHYDLVYRNNNGANGFATGHTLAVDIYMFSEKATVLSHEFVLNYNTADLTLVENGVDLNTDDFFYAAANDNAGKIKFIATAATPVEFVENEKYLVATVYFTINDIVGAGVATAEIELSISDADAYTKDEDGKTIDIEEEINAEDKIVVSKRYDANGDGNITAEDAIAIYDLAKKGGEDNYYFAAADIDGNGAVKVTDLIAFQEYFVTLA